MIPRNAANEALVGSSHLVPSGTASQPVWVSRETRTEVRIRSLGLDPSRPWRTTDGRRYLKPKE